jgi:hypothetical protein
LLSSIANGIGIQMNLIDIVIMPKEALHPQDIIALRQSQATAMGSWLQELRRLDTLVRGHQSGGDGRAR